MTENPSNPGKIRRNFSAWIARIPPGWLLVLPLLLLLPTIRSFPYPAMEAAYSDLTISHYPNAVFLRDSITRLGVIPLWSGTIMGGYPFAANPLSGMWYPPGWLALLLPLPLGFNLLIGLHLALGGIGAYKLLKSEGLGTAGPLLAGLTFGLLPKLYAHYGAGHLSLLYAVPWTPWLLLSQRTYLSSTRWFKIPPGLILALIFLADVRWGAFAGLTWWAYSAVHTQEAWGETIKKIVLQTALALLLAAPQLLPIIEFSALSTRAEMSAADVLERSLPAYNLIGLLFPNLGTIHEWVLYIGGMIGLLALGGLILGCARRNKYFWGILSLAAILVALGSQIPGSAFIAKLPLLSLLRVPSRALFLAGLGLASLAGYGLDAISNGLSPSRVKLYGLTLFGVSVFAGLLLAGFGIISGKVASGLLWGTMGIVFSAAWIWIGLKRKLSTAAWISGVFLIVMLDLVIFNLNSFVGRNAAQVLAERAVAAEYIASRGGDSPTYSPSYSLPQQTAVHHGLRLADGVDPLQIADYAAFMDDASGVPWEGYSVTIPPYANGEPSTDNVSYLPDANKLGLLNVGYVVSEFELHVEGLIFEREIEGAFIYWNEHQRYPAWVQTASISTIDELQPVKVDRRTPNQVNITASGPGRLIVSEIAYPGWEVRVDGEKRKIQTYEAILMGVDLEPGPHQVEFKFRPRSVYYGLLLFFAGLVVMVWSGKRHYPTVQREK